LGDDLAPTVAVVDDDVVDVDALTFESAVQANPLLLSI
jgi:hypothetical protein